LASQCLISYAGNLKHTFLASQLGQGQSVKSMIRMKTRGNKHMSTTHIKTRSCLNLFQAVFDLSTGSITHDQQTSDWASKLYWFFIRNELKICYFFF